MYFKKEKFQLLVKIKDWSQAYSQISKINIDILQKPLLLLKVL